MGGGEAWRGVLWGGSGWHQRVAMEARCKRPGKGVEVGGQAPLVTSTGQSMKRKLLAGIDKRGRCLGPKREQDPPLWGGTQAYRTLSWGPSGVGTEPITEGTETRRTDSLDAYSNVLDGLLRSIIPEAVVNQRRISSARLGPKRVLELWHIGVIHEGDHAFASEGT